MLAIVLFVVLFLLFAFFGLILEGLEQSANSDPVQLGSVLFWSAVFAGGFTGFVWGAASALSALINFLF